MKKKINIRTGQSAVAHKDFILRTDSIGSCIVVAIYDESTQIGGLAHAMLPEENVKAKDGGDSELQAKYADQAVALLIKDIVAAGGIKRKLEARLIGGAKMFKLLSGDNYGIGYRNIESAKKKLAEVGVPIIKEATGGTVGRLVEFNLANGVIEVITKM